MRYQTLPQCSGGPGFASSDSDCNSEQQSVPAKHFLYIFLGQHTTGKYTLNTSAWPSVALGSCISSKPLYTSWQYENASCVRSKLDIVLSIFVSVCLDPEATLAILHQLHWLISCMSHCPSDPLPGSFIHSRWLHAWIHWDQLANWSRRY